MRRLQFATLGVVYASTMVVLMAAIGVVVLHETLKWQEVLGIMLAVASIFCWRDLRVSTATAIDCKSKKTCCRDEHAQLHGGSFRAGNFAVPGSFLLLTQTAMAPFTLGSTTAFSRSINRPENATPDAKWSMHCPPRCSADEIGGTRSRRARRGAGVPAGIDLMSPAARWGRPDEPRRALRRLASRLQDAAERDREHRVAGDRRASRPGHRTGFGSGLVVRSARGQRRLPVVDSRIPHGTGGRRGGTTRRRRLAPAAPRTC